MKICIAAYVMAILLKSFDITVDQQIEWIDVFNLIERQSLQEGIQKYPSIFTIQYYSLISL